MPDHVRILFFTCAGGDEASGTDGFLPLATRLALLDRGLSFKPDLAVANGDHTYWDQWTGLTYVGSADKHARNADFYHRIAWLDEDQKFDSDANRRSLRAVVARQIASLYEDRFASTPLLFISDDHEYFENDNAGPHRQERLPEHRAGCLPVHPQGARSARSGGNAGAQRVHDRRRDPSRDRGAPVPVATADPRRGHRGTSTRGALPDPPAGLTRRPDRRPAQAGRPTPRPPDRPSAGSASARLMWQ